MRNRLRAWAPELLKRAHVFDRWWMVALAALGAGTLTGAVLPAWVLTVMTVLVMPAVAMDLVAAAVHQLCRMDWIGVECPYCGDCDDDDDDDGGDDDPETGPGDGPHYGLTVADERWLRSLSVVTDR